MISSDIIIHGITPFLSLPFIFEARRVSHAFNDSLTSRLKKSGRVDARRFMMNGREMWVVTINEVVYFDDYIADVYMKICPYFYEEQAWLEKNDIDEVNMYVKKMIDDGIKGFTINVVGGKNNRIVPPYCPQRVPDIDIDYDLEGLKKIYLDKAERCSFIKVNKYITPLVWARFGHPRDIYKRIMEAPYNELHDLVRSSMRLNFRGGRVSVITYDIKVGGVVDFQNIRVDENMLSKYDSTLWGTHGRLVVRNGKEYLLTNGGYLYEYTPGVGNPYPADNGVLLLSDKDGNLEIYQCDGKKYVATPLDKIRRRPDAGKKPCIDPITYGKYALKYST